LAKIEEVGADYTEFTLPVLEATGVSCNRFQETEADLETTYAEQGSRNKSPNHSCGSTAWSSVRHPIRE
jgi:hypothetical protein